MSRIHLLTALALPLALTGICPGRENAPKNPPASSPPAKAATGVDERVLHPKVPGRGWCDIAPQAYPDLLPRYHEVPEALNALPVIFDAGEAAWKLPEVGRIWSVGEDGVDKGGLDPSESAPAPRSPEFRNEPTFPLKW